VYFFFKSFINLLFVILASLKLVPIDINENGLNREVGIVIFSFLTTAIVISNHNDFLNESREKINYLEMYSRLLEVEKEKLNLLFYFFNWNITPIIHLHDQKKVIEEWEAYNSEIQKKQLEIILCIEEVILIVKKDSQEFSKLDIDELNVQFKKIEALKIMIERSVRNIYARDLYPMDDSLLKKKYPDIEIEIIYPSESLMNEFQTIIKEKHELSAYFMSSVLSRSLSIFHFFAEDIYESKIFYR
jgi:hypothetical protein